MSIEIKDGNFIHIRHLNCNAIISLQGAQLLQWQPKHEEGVLWSSSLSHFKVGKAFRGGIPICWPWFGKVKAPSHGFARLQVWDLDKKEEAKECVTLVFTLKNTPTTHKLFPHAFLLTLTIVLGKTLSISLLVSCYVETTGALHTYLSSQDIKEEYIYGLGNTYKDALQNHKETLSTEHLNITKEVDRVYTQSLSTTKVVSEKRKITLLHEGYSDIVVWNPWKETSSKLEDMRKDDYLKMFCVETAKITAPIKKNDTLSVHISHTSV